LEPGAFFFLSKYGNLAKGHRLVTFSCDSAAANTNRRSLPFFPRICVNPARIFVRRNKFIRYFNTKIDFFAKVVAKKSNR